METDVENGLVDTVGEEERGKLSTDIYLLPCAKQLASRRLLYNTRNPAWGFVTT